MVILQPVNLRWVKRAVDDLHDVCAHGEVVFRIGADVLLEPGPCRERTVSAAALYLLRTLSVPHTRQTPVGLHLFPCCGFAMYEVPGNDEVIICGCPGGDDFEVHHHDSGAVVVLRAGDGRGWPVTWPKWREAVFTFADQVSAFYAACSLKQPSAEDAPGFRMFQSEWQRRRGLPLGGRVAVALRPG
jgi:hypothetical protein